MNAKKRNKKSAKNVKLKSAAAVNALCVDTSNGEIGVSVIVSGSCKQAVYAAAEGSYNRDILRIIEKALKSTGTAIEDFDVFASILGPGSFTGVRVGVAAMKAFAQSAGKPFYGASALDVLAETAAAEGIRGELRPVIDARRGEVFTAAYKAGDSGVERLTDYGIMKNEEFIEKARQKKCVIVVAGTDAKLAAYIEGSGAGCFRAAHIDMKIFGQMVARGFSDKDPATVYTVMPDYVRKPDAEVNRGKKAG